MPRGKRQAPRGADRLPRPVVENVPIEIVRVVRGENLFHLVHHGILVALNGYKDL